MAARALCFLAVLCLVSWVQAAIYIHYDTNLFPSINVGPKGWGHSALVHDVDCRRINVELSDDEMAIMLSTDLGEANTKAFNALTLKFAYCKQAICQAVVANVRTNGLPDGVTSGKLHYPIRARGCCPTELAVAQAEYLLTTESSPFDVVLAATLKELSQRDTAAHLKCFVLLDLVLVQYKQKPDVLTLQNNPLALMDLHACTARHQIAATAAAVAQNKKKSKKKSKKKNNKQEAEAMEPPCLFCKYACQTLSNAGLSVEDVIGEEYQCPIKPAVAPQPEADNNNPLLDLIGEGIVNEAAGNNNEQDVVPQLGNGETPDEAAPQLGHWFLA